MKIKGDFILKQVADSFVVVPTGDSLVNFNSMTTLNESGAFLWSCLKEDISLDDLISALTSEYDIDTETAKQDVISFIDIIRKAGILDE